MEKYFFCYDLQRYWLYQGLVTDAAKMHEFTQGNAEKEIEVQQKFERIFEQLDYYKFYGIKVSLGYLECLEHHLTRDFTLKTGIEPTFKVARLYTPTGEWGFPKLDVQYGEVSTCTQSLHVGKGNNALSTYFTIAWRAKSGRVYHISDEDFNKEDVEMWFADLDVAWVHERIYPKAINLFRIKNLTYELSVYNLSENIDIHFHFKEQAIDVMRQTEHQIDEYIDQFNTRSEQKSRKDGVVHNWRTEQVGATEMVYHIDMGSAGYQFLKGLFKQLSSMACFTKVIVK